MDKLRGKTVLITAAAQGIGRASALAFHAAGAHVVATDVNEGALSALATEGLGTRRMDVASERSVADTVGAIGSVDVLFNCAGMVPIGSFLETKDDLIDRTFDLNVRSMVRTIRAVLPGMLERHDGAIINMASVIGSVTGAPNRFAYGLTKAAVIGLTKSIAADYVAQGIRCNAICPGAVETPSLVERFQAQADPAKARAAFIARQPMGRLGRPEEIADLAVYLATAALPPGRSTSSMAAGRNDVTQRETEGRQLIPRVMKRCAIDAAVGAASTCPHCLSGFGTISVAICPRECPSHLPPAPSISASPISTSPTITARRPARPRRISARS